MSAPVFVTAGVDVILQAVGAAFDFDDGRVVQETVEDGGGGGDIADKFTPFLQGTV